MSNNEVIKTAKELYDLKQMKTELEDEITVLEDRLKQEMADREVDELAAGGHVVRYTEYTAMRFDASAFKKAEPELAAAYTKATTGKRFTIA